MQTMTPLRLLAAIGLPLLFAGPVHAAAGCEALAKVRIPAAAIGLPSRGATIDSAVAVPAAKDLPATCRINGAILAASPSSPPIKFQINLPTDWNGKALQFGGGGFDGKLVDGLHSMPGNAAVSAPPPNPLARGYATFGSDAGHQATSDLDGSFGRDVEARANYEGAAVKRLHDAGMAIIRRFYGAAPKRLYFAGGSKGGHEGLVAAQRYGADYDGIIAYYPAKDSVGLIFGWGAMTEAAYGAGGTPISARKLAYVRRAVLAACDGLDGAKDGVIANVRACTATIAPSTLICSPGAPAGGDCLTPAEAATLDSGLQRRTLPFPLANGIAGVGPFPVLSGASLERSWLSDQGRAGTVYDAFVNGIVRNFWTHDDGATIASIDVAKLHDVILAHSEASDATSTDLDAFARHGGKLILVQGSADMLVPLSATTDYFTRLAARYGTKSPEIVRYFVQPGYAHGFGDFDLSWDSLAALDAWVESGTFPSEPVATDGNPASKDRQMPLCDYPAFPRFVGGDARKATSFRCAMD